MKKKLTFIKPNKDHYDLDYVLCLEKPMAIIAEGNRQNFGSFFYILIKLYRTYLMRELNDTDSFYQTNREIFSKLSMRLYNLPVNDDIHTVICDRIDLQQPVVVVGNLRKLYYSEHYKKSDWVHLFLIKGYDKKKDLYYIMDNIHKVSDSNKFEEYVILPEMLEELFVASVEACDKKFIFAAENTDEDINEVQLLMSIIHEIQSASIIGKEIIAMEYAQQDQMIEESLAAHSVELLRMVKYKQVLYKELIAQFSRLEIQELLLIELKQATDQLAETWNYVIKDFILSHHREELFDVREKAKSAIEVEQAIRTVLRKIMLELEKMQDVREKAGVGLQTLWVEENNEQGIINFTESTVSFNFTNEEIFAGSEYPRLVYRKPIDRNFTFNIELIIDNEKEHDSFQAGIYFQTQDGESYIWGMQGDKIVLVQDGSLQPFYHRQIKQKNVMLKIEYEGDTYRFIYFLQDGTPVKAFESNLIDSTVRIGVGCRAWDPVSQLNLTFEKVILTDAAVLLI